MTEISATDVSKRFAALLDAVERRGESFTVVRCGRAIATVAPTRRSTLGSFAITAAELLRGAHDLQIAATARATRRTILTTDVDAFTALPGVSYRVIPLS